MPESFILAVDGGGTKTTVWLANLQGEKLSEVTVGPLSFAAVTPEQAKSNLQIAVDEILQSHPDATLEKVVIGLAGVDTSDEVSKATQLFMQMPAFAHAELKVVNDIEIALASGSTAPDAICLISGTGSNCFGKNSQGKTWKTGGMDYLLSDEGSGYAIGLAVLRTVVRSCDHRMGQTALVDLIFQHFEVGDARALKAKVYSPVLSKTQIAELSPFAFQAAMNGDELAKKIVERAISDLAVLVNTVARELEFKDKAFDLVLAGGIAKDPTVNQPLLKLIQAEFPQVKIVLPEHPPVYGALRLAI